MSAMCGILGWLGHIHRPHQGAYSISQNRDQCPFPKNSTSRGVARGGAGAVSYTHLTLPTIYSV